MIVSTKTNKPKLLSRKKRLLFILSISFAFTCQQSFSQQLPQNINFKSKKPFKFPLPGKTDLSLYKDLFKPGIKINSLWGESGFISNKGLFSNDSLVADNLLQYNTRNVASVSIAGIPVMAEYTFRRSTPAFSDLSPTQWYKISFDVEKYKEQWKKIAERLSPESLSEFGKQYKDLEKTFKDRIVSRYSGMVKDKLKNQFDSISQKINPLELAEKTPEELTALFFGQDIPSLIANAKEKLKQTEGFEMVKEKKDSALNELRTKIEELEAKQKYVEELVNTLKQAKSSGMMGSMKELFDRSTEEYQKLLANPQELAQRMAAKYHLNGIAKLITILSQFKLGGQAVPFAEQQVTPFLSKGISFEINIKDKFIGFSAGRLFPMINTLQFPGLDSLNGNKSYQPNYWFLNYRKGKLTESHKGIKLTSIENAGTNVNPLQSPDFIKKNTLLLNLYSRERIFGNNWLSAELSKSITVSTKQFIIDNSGRSVEKKPAIFDWNNLSVKIKMEGVVENIGLSHQAYFNKTIGTFANFTTNYPATNGYEAGFSVRVKEKGKKLSSYLKGSFRNYDVPGFTGSKWKNTDLRMRTAYKLKKGQSVQITSNWHDGYKTYFLSSEQRTIRQQSKGIGADASLVNKRIFGLFNTSYVSVSMQKDYFPVTGLPGKDKIVSNSVSVLLNQTFLYREHLLLMNISYTHVSQDIDALLYNTQLDADLGGTFRINKNITAGFSMVYGYLKGAYSNAGIRASFSGVLFKRIELDINSDVRKNITLSNPLFSQFFNLNCGIKYNIKK